MDYSVCSRETNRDYSWDNSNASAVLAEYARNFFAPALEGSLTTSRFAALLRCPGSPCGVVLCVSVSTPRRDSSNRPIRTMACLLAETESETALLVSFYAECLRQSDASTIYDAASPIAKAVESLFLTKNSDAFIGFCRSLPEVNCHARKVVNCLAIRRDNLDVRHAIADDLCSFVKGSTPFLIALTDRAPQDVLSTLGSMFDRGLVRIFSKSVENEVPIHRETLDTRVVAAVIGGTILIAAAIGLFIFLAKRGGDGKSNSGSWRNDKTPVQTNGIVRAIDN